jgi:hypothetical protein
MRKIEPDICFLFGTDPGVNEVSGNTYNLAIELKGLLKTNEQLKNTKIVPIPLHLPDPTDYKQILINFEKHIKEIRKKYQTTNPTYHVNISSGTAQMHAAFLVVLNGIRMNAFIYQVKDPRFVKDKMDRVVEVDITFIEEENFIRRAKRMFDRYDFEQASLELIELGAYTIREKRRVRAELYSRLCDAYKNWDIYDHEKARDIIKEEVMKELKRFGVSELYDIVKEQVLVLENVCKDKPRETIITIKDLMHNADRKRDTCQYIDCLTRYKRLIEGLIACKCGIDGSKRIDQLPEWARRSLRDKQGNGYFNIHDYFQLYEAKYNKPFFSLQLSDKNKGLSKKRNLSVAAHGMASVTKNEAREAMNILWKAAQAQYPKEKWKDYVFSCDSIKNISSIVFNNL